VYSPLTSPRSRPREQSPREEAPSHRQLRPPRRREEPVRQGPLRENLYVSLRQTQRVHQEREAGRAAAGQPAADEATHRAVAAPHPASRSSPKKTSPDTGPASRTAETARSATSASGSTAKTPSLSNNSHLEQTSATPKPVRSPDRSRTNTPRERPSPPASTAPLPATRGRSCRAHSLRDPRPRKTRPTSLERSHTRFEAGPATSSSSRSCCSKTRTPADTPPPPIPSSPSSSKTTQARQPLAGGPKSPAPSARTAAASVSLCGCWTSLSRVSRSAVDSSEQNSSGGRRATSTNRCSR